MADGSEVGEVAVIPGSMAKQIRYDLPDATGDWEAPLLFFTLVDARRAMATRTCFVAIGTAPGERMRGCTT